MEPPLGSPPVEVDAAAHVERAERRHVDVRAHDPLAPVGLLKAGARAHAEEGRVYSCSSWVGGGWLDWVGLAWLGVFVCSKINLCLFAHLVHELNVLF